MKTISKALVGTVAAGAMAMASATPAFANDRRDNDGIGVGEIIAGALIIGGIAAVAGSIGNNRNDRYRDRTYGGPYYGNDRYNDRYGDRYDDRYGDRYGDRNDNRYGYNRAGNPRQAVQQCVNAAQSTANRYSNGRARVTDIRDIKRSRDGYRVKGTIVVNERNRGWGRDYNYRSRGRDYDTGRFTCDVRYGRVVDLDYSGIRGLG